MIKQQMRDYTIDFYDYDEFSTSYTLLSTDIDFAIQTALQEFYLDEHIATYYIAYSNDSRETKSGWLI